MWAGKVAEACGWPHEVRRFKPRGQVESLDGGYSRAGSTQNSLPDGSV